MPLFMGLDEGVLRELVQRLKRARVMPGEPLYSAGDAGGSLFVAIEGKIKILRPASGRDHLIALIGPGEEFGEPVGFDDGRCQTSACAQTLVEVGILKEEDLDELISIHPVMATRLLKVLAQRMRRVDGIASDLVDLDAAGRLAKQLLDLASRFGVEQRGCLRVTHELTQAELAQLVGASRETVNKTLSNFAERGWIRAEPKSVVIYAPNELARRAR
jgi:CRP-like cAMP-binding protein